MSLPLWPAVINSACSKWNPRLCRGFTWKMCRLVTSWGCFRIKDLFQYGLDAAFSWQWQDNTRPCSYSCSYLFCLLLSDWAPATISPEAVVMTFYSIRKGVSLHVCCFHLHWKQRWMCKGTKDTGIYLAPHGGALFKWKWLCPTPRFCKCRIRVYNEHICGPSFFWSFFVVAHFLPSSVAPSSPSHHLLIITVPTYLPHTLTRSAYHAFLLPLSPSLLCRSSSHPSVPYHYYEPKGPDECSMYLSHESSRQGSHHRFITEKAVFANWARTLNVHFHHPDWKPVAVVSGLNSSHTWFFGWMLGFRREVWKCSRADKQRPLNNVAAAVHLLCTQLGRARSSAQSPDNVFGV